MTLAIVGDTVTDSRLGAVTIRVTPGLVTVPEAVVILAVIMVLPLATEVARPVFNPILATLGVPLVQLAVVVMGTVPLV